MHLFDLGERVAIITGGNGGIGLGMALGLAAAGARAVVAGRDETKNRAAVAALSTHAPAASVTADVTRPVSCRALVEETRRRLGRLDIPLGDSGINIRRQPQDDTAAEWHRVLDANLSGAFFCAESAYPALRDAGAGKIINIGSMMSLFGAANGAGYAASKGGIVQLTKARATASAADNIQMNAVLPGWIDTDLTRATRRTVATLHDSMLSRTPAERWGVPDDLAGIRYVPGEPRLRLHHRHGDPGRWRLRGAGLGRRHRPGAARCVGGPRGSSVSRAASGAPGNGCPETLPERAGRKQARRTCASTAPAASRPLLRRRPTAGPRPAARCPVGGQPAAGRRRSMSGRNAVSTPIAGRKAQSR